MPPRSRRWSPPRPHPAAPLPDRFEGAAERGQHTGSDHPQFLVPEGGGQRQHAQERSLRSGRTASADSSICAPPPVSTVRAAATFCTLHRRPPSASCRPRTARPRHSPACTGAMATPTELLVPLPSAECSASTYPRCAQRRAARARICAWVRPRPSLPGTADGGASAGSGKAATPPIRQAGRRPRPRPESRCRLQID